MFPYQNPYQFGYGSMYQNYGQNPGTGIDRPPAPKYEIIHVNGENGARALQMAENSNALLLDDTAPIVWLAQTDGAGYKTVTPYSITPYQPEQPVDVKSLEGRIKKLEDMINGKYSNAEPNIPETGREQQTK